MHTGEETSLVQRVYIKTDTLYMRAAYASNCPLQRRQSSSPDDAPTEGLLLSVFPCDAY